MMHEIHVNHGDACRYTCVTCAYAVFISFIFFGSTRHSCLGRVVPLQPEDRRVWIECRELGCGNDPTLAKILCSYPAGLCCACFRMFNFWMQPMTELTSISYVLLDPKFWICLAIIILNRCSTIINQFFAMKDHDMMQWMNWFEADVPPAVKRLRCRVTY